MASTRLPGKALADIHGKPLLQRLCNRLKLCKNVDEIIVATSNEHQDDVIADACAEWNVLAFRGPESDLTARFLGAAEAYNLDLFVRVTADNPLTDPHGVDDLVEMLAKHSCHAKDGPMLVHNMHRNGYPYGTGAEAGNRELLDLCERDLVKSHDREYFISHVKRHPERFPIIEMNAESSFRRPQYFLTVDYPEDIELIRAIYTQVPGDNELSLADAIGFLDANPSLARVNSHLHKPFAE